MARVPRNPRLPAALLASVVFAAPLGAGQVPAPAKRPSILLVVVDTLRWDAGDPAAGAGAAIPSWLKTRGTHYSTAAVLSNPTLAGERLHLEGGFDVVDSKMTAMEPNRSVAIRHAPQTTEIAGAGSSAGIAEVDAGMRRIRALPLPERTLPPDEIRKLRALGYLR